MNCVCDASALGWRNRLPSPDNRQGISCTALNVTHAFSQYNVVQSFDYMIRDTCNMENRAQMAKYHLQAV